MLRILLPLALCVLCFGHAVASEAVAFRDYPNLVYNASFEHEDFLDGDRTEFWFNRNYLTRDSSISRSGSVSLRIDGPVANGYTFQSPFALLPDTAYELRIRVRTDGSVSGDGVRLVYNQTEPSSVALGGTSWSGSSSGSWKTLTGTFTTGATHESGWLRIFFDLNAGDRAWIDDVEVVPVSGNVPVASSPQLSAETPAVGPAMVTITTPTPGTSVHYTTDGSDPTVFSVEYRAPFPVSADAEVKARVFHNGRQESPVASLDVDVSGGLIDGIPFTPIDWSAEVQTWWEHHRLNPDADAYWGGTLPTPDPVIDVAEVRANHPSTTTAGIEEALAQLPPEGGTLYFPTSGSPYEVTKPSSRVFNYYYLDGAIHVLRRNNIHFVSDGATIRHSDYLMGFSSMEYADTFGSATGATKSEPSRGFTFRGLTFDGSGATHQAFLFRHCRDIVFQDCDFVNYGPSPGEHHGPVNATSMTDNIWMLNCEIETEGLAVYIDGVHNGGFVNCRFDVGDNKDAIMMFTNNDMWEWSAEQRSTQYVVVADSEFAGPGKEAIQATSANLLVLDNRVTGGTYNSLISQTGRGPSNLQRYLYYNGSGLHAEGNEADSLINFAVFRADVSQHTRTAQKTLSNRIVNNTVDSALTFARFEGSDVPSPMENFEIRGNRVSANLRTMARLRPSGGHLVQAITIEDNDFFGTDLPRIEVAAQPVDEVLVTHNDLYGNERPLLDNVSGQSLPSGAVTFSGNRINPEGVAEPSIQPSGGFFWDAVSVTLAPGEAGDDVFYAFDAADPQSEGTPYSGTLVLPDSTQLRARARDTSGGWSDIVAADFEIGDSTEPPSAPDGLGASATGSGYNLRWGPSSGRPDGYRVERSVDGIHFAGVTEVASETTEWEDLTADPAEVYYYRVLALRGGLESTPSAVLYAAPIAAPPFTFVDWDGSDIGVPAQSGMHDVLTEAVEIQAGGTDIWGSSDEGYYFYQEASGDWDFAARLAAFDPDDGWAKAGLMLRDGLGSGAAHFTILVSGSNGVHRQARTSTGNATGTVSGSAASAPHWLRLKKTGTQIVAYESADGQNWTEVDRSSWGFDDPSFVGFVASAHDSEQRVTATFDSVTWDGAASSGGGNPLAPEQLTAAASGGLRIDLAWESDTSPETYVVERSAEGGTFAPVAIVDGEARDFVDAGLRPDREYTYRIAARGNETQSAYSTEAVARAGPLSFAEWQLLAAPVSNHGSMDLGPSADYNGDGLPNGLKWAMGFDPGDRMPGPALRLVNEGGTLKLEYWERQPPAAGGDLVVYGSSDLGGWSELDISSWGLEVMETGDNRRRVRRTPPVPDAADSQFFMLGLQP